MISVKELNIFAFIISHLFLFCLCDFSNEWLVEIHAKDRWVKDFADRNGFRYINKIGDNMFVLRHEYSPTSSKVRAHDISKTILKEEKVVYAEQQKWNKRVKRSYLVNDPYWRNMWYLNGRQSTDMGVMSAWSKGYTGKGVTIGIVDDGVDFNHPDLKPNFNAKLSIDLYERDNDPSPNPGDLHGTECAGITVAAANNTNCIVGVAFNARIAGLRIEGSSGTTSTGERDALLAPGIDIYSNSWGVLDKVTFEGPSSIVKSALLQGTQKGRNGLGAIYVWAAGNGGTDDNCNCDGFVNSIHTIAISSVSYKFQPPGYAEPCAAIMASTFSGGGGSTNNICTTSLNSTCVTSFSGTSAAAPMAAGIFALVLQANPSLTWRDLQHLIVNTSSLSNLKYGREQINGAGHTVSDYFGFGLLNSELLVEAAQHWKSVKEQHICLTANKKPFPKAQIFPKDLNRKAESTIFTNGCNSTENEIQRIEHVEVDVTFTFSLRGSIQLFLISPSGTKSQLLTRRNHDNMQSSSLQWTFMTLQFWDENPYGNWILQMSLDMDYKELGEVNNWSLRIYGTTTTKLVDEGDGSCLLWLLFLLLLLPVVGGGAFSYNRLKVKNKTDNTVVV